MTIRPSETTFDKITQATKDVGPAFRAAWPYMLLGFLMGSLLLFLHGQISQIVKVDTVWTRLLEHLGAGFFVSSLAVFGYEWRAHIIRTLETAERLTDGLLVVDSAIATLNKSERLINAMERQEEIKKTSAEEGFKKCLSESLCGKDGDDNAAIEKIAYDCKDFVSLVSALRDRGGWVDLFYLNFLSTIFHERAVKLGHLLVALGGNKEEENEEHRLLITLNSARVGDLFLEAHMKALGRRDKYWVISDLNTWRSGCLERFRAATQEAVTKRGVVVVRIFDLVANRADFSKEEMEDSLRRHLEDARDWESESGKYIVKVLGPVEYRSARKKAASSNLSEDELRDLHFGLFVHVEEGGGEERLQVEVRKPDLSDLAISRSDDLIRDNLKKFRILEQAAAGLSFEDLKEKVHEVYK